MSYENVYQAITANDTNIIDQFINDGTDINSVLFYVCATNKTYIMNHLINKYGKDIDLDIIQTKISKVTSFRNCDNSFQMLKNLVKENDSKYQIVDIPDTLDISNTPEISQLVELKNEINYGRATNNIFEAIKKDNISDIDFYINNGDNVDKILFYVCTINKKHIINHIINNFKPDIKSIYNKLIDSRWQLQCDDSIEYLGDIIMAHEYNINSEISPIAERIEIKDASGDSFEIIDHQIDLNPEGYIFIGPNKKDHINMISKKISKTYDNIITHAVLFKIPSLLIACYLSENDDCLDIIKELIKVGVNLSMNYNGLTPLGLAIEGHNKKTIEFLIEKGANINITNENGDTILMLAYKHSNNEKYLDIVQLLLNKGADISIKNKSGKTIFDFVRGDY
ncbi:repeat protein [Moumouvirus goulette]|uniref:Repeat protein n=1 Tax=Moumouvirus goulette TaxID=1247379 RepID=M1PG07_9VIRU|nr:repeat protein [Moumouvirus goulette]AGF84908.1 repeat protein [Moumouvirus goulette]